MLEQHNYVHKKEVDWSVLQQGVNIPVTIQVIFQSTVNRFIQRGQSKEIYLILEGRTYKARLVNQKFDEQKYFTRKDILQIRYHPQSEIAEKLRSIFTASYRYLIWVRTIDNTILGLLLGYTWLLLIPKIYVQSLELI